MKKANVRVLSFLLVSMLSVSCLSGCSLVQDGGASGGSSTPPIDESNSGTGGSIETVLTDVIDKENGRPDFDSMFDYESGYVPEEIPEYVPEEIYPSDTGTKIKYRMEAENAEFKLAEQTGDNAWKNAYNDYNNLGFGLQLSGGLATRNCNVTGTQTIFKFKSDKSYSDIQLDVMYGGYPNETLAISDIADIRVNDRSLDTTDMTIASADCALLGHNQYMIFKLVTFKISIKEGENVICFESLKARGNNFDYIELNTSANITGWDNTHFSDEVNSVWEVTQEPTLTSTGNLRVTSTVDGTDRVLDYTLPTLGAANGYTVKELADGQSEYSFKVKDKEYKYTINTSAKSTLTLQVPAGISFADGTMSASLKAGDAMPQVTNTTGREIAGWFNVTTGTKYDNFVMPAEDCTVAPYFRVKDGFKQLTIGNEQATNLPQPVSGGVDKTLFSYADNQLIAGGANGFTEVGRVYAYSGTVAAGEYFRFASKVGSSGEVKTRVNHTFHFNIENKGETAIDLTLYMVNSSTTHEAVDGEVNKPVVIQLAAGESTSFDMVVNYKNGSNNNNALALFEVNSEMSDFSIGISKSVKLGS